MLTTSISVLIKTSIQLISVLTQQEGITPVWVIDGAYSSDYTLSKYYRKKGTYNVECFVKNRNGISKESVKKQFNIEKTKMNGFAGFVEDSEFNLFKTNYLP